MKAKIVVADDEPRIRAMIALLLKEDGYEGQTRRERTRGRRRPPLLPSRRDLARPANAGAYRRGGIGEDQTAMPEPSRRVHNRLRFRLLGGRCRKERRLRFY